MLKDYLYNGKQFQFKEGEQPAGAVEVTAVKPPEAKKAEPKHGVMSCRKMVASLRS